MTNSQSGFKSYSAYLSDRGSSASDYMWREYVRTHLQNHLLELMIATGVELINFEDHIDTIDRVTDLFVDVMTSPSFDDDLLSTFNNEETTHSVTHLVSGNNNNIRDNNNAKL